MWGNDAKFSSLKGKTLMNVEVNSDNTEITFTVDGGEQYRMLHEQDCCEDVRVEDINGELSDLIGTPILSAEVVSNSDEPPLSSYEESYTWTFYKIATIKGSVTIRWYGTSNGYYSEGVSFVRV